MERLSAEAMRLETIRSLRQGDVSVGVIALQVLMPALSPAHAVVLSIAHHKTDWVLVADLLEHVVGALPAPP